MKTRVLIVVTALLLAAAGFTVAQQQNSAPHFPGPPGAAATLPPPDHGSSPPLPPLPSTVHTLPVAKEVKPEDLTIDQLIDEVSKIREEKAKLAKKEELFLKTMTGKAAKQKERIDSLLGVAKVADNPAQIPGITPPLPDQAGPHRQP